MRIIAGIYRGRILKSPQGFQTRPTSDRLRESIFNILSPNISGETRFLDLCAGSGAMGIEAISRGAAHSVFVDRSKKACAVIQSNLDLLDIRGDLAVVAKRTAKDFLKKGGVPFDIIYYDPPYAEDYADILSLLAQGESLLSDNGLLLAEHHSKKMLPDEIGMLRRWRLLKQGESSVSFFKRD